MNARANLDLLRAVLAAQAQVDGAISLVSSGLIAPKLRKRVLEKLADAKGRMQAIEDHLLGAGVAQRRDSFLKGEKKCGEL